MSARTAQTFVQADIFFLFLSPFVTQWQTSYSAEGATFLTGPCF